MSATWNGEGIMPLAMFPPEKRTEIERLAALPDPPDKWHYLGGPDDPRPLARIMSRAYYEWWLRRGRNVLDGPVRERIPQGLRETIIARDGLACRICDGAVEPGEVHIDHILPVSRGGRTVASNLQVAHATCNLRKGNRA